MDIFLFIIISIMLIALYDLIQHSTAYMKEQNETIIELLEKDTASATIIELLKEREK